MRPRCSIYSRRACGRPSSALARISQHSTNALRSSFWILAWRSVRSNPMATASSEPFLTKFMELRMPTRSFVRSWSEKYRITPNGTNALWAPTVCPVPALDNNYNLTICTFPSLRTTTTLSHHHCRTKPKVRPILVTLAKDVLCICRGDCTTLFAVANLYSVDILIYSPLLQEPLLISPQFGPRQKVGLLQAIETHALISI